MSAPTRAPMLVGAEARATCPPWCTDAHEMPERADEIGHSSDAAVLVPPPCGYDVDPVAFAARLMVDGETGTACVFMWTDSFQVGTAEMGVGELDAFLGRLRAYAARLAEMREQLARTPGARP